MPWTITAGTLQGLKLSAITAKQKFPKAVQSRIKCYGLQNLIFDHTTILRSPTLLLVIYTV